MSEIPWSTIGRHTYNIVSRHPMHITSRSNPPIWLEEQLRSLHLVLHHLQKLHEVAILGPRKMSTEAIATAMTSCLPQIAWRGRFDYDTWIAVMNAMEIICGLLQLRRTLRFEISIICIHKASVLISRESCQWPEYAGRGQSRWGMDGCYEDHIDFVADSVITSASSI